MCRMHAPPPSVAGGRLFPLLDIFAPAFSMCRVHTPPPSVARGCLFPILDIFAPAFSMCCVHAPPPSVTCGHLFPFWALLPLLDPGTGSINPACQSYLGLLWMLISSFGYIRTHPQHLRCTCSTRLGRPRTLVHFLGIIPPAGSRYWPTSPGAQKSLRSPAEITFPFWLYSLGCIQAQVAFNLRTGSTTLVVADRCDWSLSGRDY
jgi:hypothetical protein